LKTPPKASELVPANESVLQGKQYFPTTKTSHHPQHGVIWKEAIHRQGRGSFYYSFNSFQFG
jgi:hypothetical protein